MSGPVALLFDEEASTRTRALNAAWLAHHGGEEDLAALEEALYGEQDFWTRDLATTTAMAIFLRQDRAADDAAAEAAARPNLKQLDELPLKELEGAPNLAIATTLREGGIPERTWERVGADHLPPPLREVICQICAEKDGARLASAILDLVRGPWQVVSTREEVRRRVTVTRVLLFDLCRSDPSLRKRFHDRLPEIDREVRGGEEIGGKLTYRTGRIGCTVLGLNDYDVHIHWPIDGFAVDKDKIEVCEPDGTRVPVLAWLADAGITVLCPKCGGIVSDGVEPGCPAGLLRR